MDFFTYKETMPFQESKNIKFCAYLRLKGIHPSEVKKDPNARGKATFLFKMDDKEWSMHQIEFNQSKFLDYANNLEAIKDMAY
jgi:hypothetical protein